MLHEMKFNVKVNDACTDVQASTNFGFDKPYFGIPDTDLRSLSLVARLF
jgi:hypothetical protein